MLTNVHDVSDRLLDIIDRVMAMKEVTMTTTIPSECDVAEESEWTVYLRELRGNYYNET